MASAGLLSSDPLLLCFSSDGGSTGSRISDKSLANRANKLDVNDVNITGPQRRFSQS